MAVTVRRVFKTIGVGIYVVVTRTALSIAVVFTALFFILNSSGFPDMLFGALKGVIPGSFEAGRIQISPVPWIVDVTDFAIKTPAGVPIIKAGQVRVKVKLVPLLTSLVNLDQRKLRLEFSSVRLYDFLVLLRFDDANHLELVDAFDAPGRKPPSSNPLRILLGIEHISGTNGEAFLQFPDWDIRLNGIDMKTDFSLETSPVHVRVDAEYFNYLFGVAHIRAGSGAGIPGQVLLKQGLIDGFTYNWNEISFERFRAGFDFGSLVATRGYLSWAKNLEYSIDANLELPEANTAVKSVTRGLLSGPLSISLGGRGDRSNPEFAARVDSPALKIGGVDLGVVHLEASGARDETGTYRIFDVAGSARSGVSSLNISEGLFEPSPADPELKWNASAALAFTRVNVAAILRTLNRKISPRAIPVPGGSTGELRLGVSALRGPEGPGPVDPTPELRFSATGSVSGRISRKGVLQGTTYRLDLSAVLSGRNLARPVLSVSELRLACGLDTIDVRGTLDLERDRLLATGSVVKDLGAMMKPFGVVMAGTAALEGVRLSGRASRPSGSASVSLAGFEYAGWKVISANAEATLQAGTFDLQGLHALTPFARVDVRAASVFLPSLAGNGQPGAVDLAGIRLAAVDVGRIPLFANVEGTGYGSAERLEFMLSDPVGTMSGDAVLHLDRIEAYGRALEFVTLKATATRGNAESLVADALVRGGGSVSVRGSWDFKNDMLDVGGEVRNVPLRTLLVLKPDSVLAGTLSATARVSGSLTDPAILASVDLPDFSYGEHRFAPVSAGASRLPGGDLMLSSERLFRAMKVGGSSRVFWREGRFSGMSLDIDIIDLKPQDVIPAIPARKLSGGLTARLTVDMPSFSDGAIAGRLESPPGGLWLELMNLQTRVENRDPLRVVFHSDGRILVSGVTLDDGVSRVSLCGENNASGLRAMVRGSVGTHWLRALKGTFSNADGELIITGRPGAQVDLPGGCDQSMAEGGGGLSVSGDLRNPVLDGVIRTGLIGLGIRGFGDPVGVEAGGEVVLEPRPSVSGQMVTTVTIPDEHWISGSLGDGSFNLSGEAFLRDGRLEDGWLRLNGSQVRYVSTGEFFVVAEPRLMATFEKIGLMPGSAVDSIDAGIAISGQVDVTDGSYHKDFSLVRNAFSSITGDRVAKRTGGGLLKAVPWLEDARLDVAVRASSFGVRTSLVVGETDLDVAVNVNLRGTLKYPEIYNRVEVLPGGTFTYNVVRREFEVLRGAVDFDGEAGHPELDVTARTYIEYSGFSGGMVAASRFSPDDGNDAFYGDMIQVNLSLSGRYPDLDIEISSPSRGISQNDLQVLLLTGIAPGQSVTAGAGSFVNMNLLTGSVTDSLVKVMLADLVDSVNVGVSPSGDVNLDVSAHIGRRLKFQTQVQQGAGTSQYSTGFKIRLTEGLSLEGRLKAVEFSADQDDIGRNYDTRLRYRIPIE